MECCICLEIVENLIKFNPCDHQNICIKCFLKTRWNQCPICRQKILYSNGCDISIIVQNMCDLELAEKYFKSTQNYLNTQNKDKICLETISKTIFQIYQNFADKKICLVSVDQCETLLKIIIDKYTGCHHLERILVCSCREGWKIDMKLGADGIRYYGNRGKIPNSIETTMSYVKSNHRTMMSSHICNII